jgi:DNA-3-methyladenine glycosylase I
MTNPELVRCGWVNLNEPLYVAYHDDEWGNATRDDRRLFEMLCLEGAQAGLSWITILKKRANYRTAFDGFDPVKMARYDEAKIAALLANPGIVRNRLKVNAFVGNARAYLDLRESGTTLNDFLWGFVGGEPIINHWKSLSEVPAETPESQAMSKALLKKGFRFVGPTICYAFMQACGMVDDHTVDCFKRGG